MEIPYSEEVTEKPTKNSDGNFDFSLVDLKLARNYTQGSRIVPVRLITPVGQSAQEMKITDGTDILAINADGSINANSFNPFTVTYTRWNNNTAGSAFTSVPAGKRWYIIAIHNQVNTGFAYISDSTGVTVNQRLCLGSLANTPVAVAEATERVYLTNQGSIVYYEVTL